jgi:para-aminobenzoate synthetase component 1
MIQNKNSAIFVEEIPFCSTITAFNKVSKEKWSILFDSARYDDNCGRYSYIAVDPFKTLEAKNGKIFLDDCEQTGNPLLVLKNLLKEYSLSPHSELPPFQGGAAGAFSYDLFQYIENFTSHAKDEMNFPDLALGFFDVIAAFDHLKQKAWIISTGYPEIDFSRRQTRATQRGKWLRELISCNATEAFTLTPSDLSEEQINSNFTPDAYMSAVNLVKEYIFSGDIYEANISQCFSVKTPSNFLPFQLFCRLRCNNPAPFSAFANFGDWIVVSASPERFLKLTEKKVETRPIKGTRPRSKDVEEDKKLAYELENSIKDRAENIMIVDLMRNDLSRVCKHHSVVVKQLCQLESYTTVHHLVSVVEGELHPEKDAVDLLLATFPGGSVTGAPKIRAIEIISEIEPNKRGIYCGSLGYISFTGNMDCSIAIRTFAIDKKNEKIFFQAGGAIVADSDPMSEYLETLSKVSALRSTLTQKARIHD